MGIETIWVADHLADRGGQLRYHGWTCLAALAEQTSRARIGTLVSPMTLHNPAVLAKAALTVDHASGGRLELGLGSGGSDLDLQLAGVQSPTDDDFRGFRGLSEEEGLSRSRDRNAQLDRFCDEAGRDPRSVIRSALIGYPFVAETPWRSEASFQDFVRRWGEAGFDEVIIYYPPDWGMPEGSVEVGLFERMLGEG